MPLSYFNHNGKRHFRSQDGAESKFHHRFGGTANCYGIKFTNSDTPFQIVYALDLADPELETDVPCDVLPLIYGFNYASNGEEFVYSINENREIEILVPDTLQYNLDFPYDDYPSSFGTKPTSFYQIPYDQHSVDDAFSLQGVFGIDSLSADEIDRANCRWFAEDSPERFPNPEWGDEDFFRRVGSHAPFFQDSPARNCTNPRCTADISYYVEPMEIEVDGVGKIEIGGYDVRVDTMRTFAIHENEISDETMWGFALVQLIFEYCTVCGCIRVSNQCT